MARRRRMRTNEPGVWHGTADVSLRITPTHAVGYKCTTFRFLVLVIFIIAMSYGNRLQGPWSYTWWRVVNGRMFLSITSVQRSSQHRRQT
ncbi:hypothetical protein LY78DRAFT_391765 [Colletotrichum sublineola]|nr:hypothetical protein LY78DRAFT_391765 [Colletotrichum sublineola]